MLHSSMGGDLLAVGQFWGLAVALPTFPQRSPSRHVQHCVGIWPSDLGFCAPLLSL